MKNLDPSDDSALKHLQIFFYLIPIIGFFPSLWTIYRHGRRIEQGRRRAGELGVSFEDEEKEREGAREEVSKELLAVSRLSVTLAGSWLLLYLLLGSGAEASDFLMLRLSILNSLFTSGYFLVSVWLMVRLFSHKSLRLPGFSQLAERMLNK